MTFIEVGTLTAKTGPLIPGAPVNEFSTTGLGFILLT